MFGPRHLLPGETLTDYERRARTYDSAFLPARRGRDQDPQSPRIVARLDPLPDDEVCHYELEEQQDGSVAVVLVPGPDDQVSQGEFSTVGDRGLVHRLYGRDRTLRQINNANRRYWARDRKTRDGDRRMTLFRHTPQPNERLVLEGPDENGFYDLIPISPATSEMVGNVPLGANGDGPEVRSMSRSGDGRYGRNTESAALHRQNQANKRFWARG